jgi:hypothetical protein
MIAKMATSKGLAIDLVIALTFWADASSLRSPMAGAENGR